MVICLERGADLHMAQLMPLPLTVSCFSKIQTGFTFLVPAHPGSPGQRAVKRAYVYCNYRTRDPNAGKIGHVVPTTCLPRDRQTQLIKVLGSAGAVRVISLVRHAGMWANERSSQFVSSKLKPGGRWCRSRDHGSPGDERTNRASSTSHRGPLYAPRHLCQETITTAISTPVVHTPEIQRLLAHRRWVPAGACRTCLPCRLDRSTWKPVATHPRAYGTQIIIIQNQTKDVLFCLHYKLSFKLKSTSISCCRWTRATCSSVINWSSTVASVVNFVRPTTVQFIAQQYTFIRPRWQHAATIYMPWRNFLSTQFAAKFQSKVPYFGDIWISLKHRLEWVEEWRHGRNQLSQYRVGQKWHHKLMAIILSYFYQLSKCFHFP